MAKIVMQVFTASARRPDRMAGCVVFAEAVRVKRCALAGNYGDQGVVDRVRETSVLTSLIYGFKWRKVAIAITCLKMKPHPANRGMGFGVD